MLIKDDPVYYKVKLEKLLKNAKENGLKVQLEYGRICFKVSSFKIAGVKI